MSHGLLAVHSSRAMLAPFPALCIGIWSPAVISRMVSQLGLTKRNVGQVMLAVGAIIGAVGFLTLLLVSALTVSGGGALGALCGPWSVWWCPWVWMALFGQRLVDPCHPCTADHSAIGACSRSMA